MPLMLLSLLSSCLVKESSLGSETSSGVRSASFYGALVSEMEALGPECLQDLSADLSLLKLGVS